MPGKKDGKIAKVAAVLRNEFSDAHLKNGIRTPSAKEIAERFGLSVPTAHEAVKLLVEEGLLYRVRGSGTFIRRIGRPRSFRIALLECPAMPVPPSLHNVYLTQIENLIAFLKKSGYIVQVVAYLELRDRAAALELLRNFDGLLVSNGYMDDYSCGVFRESGVPFVVFRHLFELPENCSQVYVDLNPGMRQAIAMLKPEDLVHPVVFQEQSYNTRGIASLWRQNLIRAGVPESNIETVEINYFRRSQQCYRHVRVYCQSLAKKIIFTATDGLAYNIIDAFMLENLEPGRDFRLVSCGNREGQGFRFADEAMITSVDAPEKIIMHEATKMLLMKIEQPSACEYIVRIPSELVIRKTFY